MSQEERSIYTDGGAYIGGKVEIHGGDFVGRDKITIYEGPAYARPDYRSDISDILTFYTATFVGRTQERADLMAFAARKRPGYRLLKALPGYGKSALVAQLIHLQETGRWDGEAQSHLLYFFVRQQEGNNTPEEFLKAINAQLLTLCDLSGGVPPERNALRSQFSELWAVAVRAASAQAPLLLLVDGLDEMGRGEVTIAGLLPANLSPYVHVIVTSRPHPDPLEQVRLEHPLREAEVHWLGAFDVENVEALLLEYGASAGAATHLAPRVLATTQGQPLFARFVSQDVAAKGEAVLERLEENPPAGVEDYFRQQFKQLDETAEADLTWDILGLMVVALGGLSADELAGILQVGKRRVRQALDPVRRYLLGEERLALMHVQLREVLAEDLTEGEQGALQKQLLAYCAKWPEHRSAYALAHYVDHLAEANLREDLYALVLDEEFRVAQHHVLGNVHTTLGDLRLALELALETESVVTALACAATMYDTVKSTGDGHALFRPGDAELFSKVLELVALNDWALDQTGCFSGYVASVAACHEAGGVSNTVNAIFDATDRKQFGEAVEWAHRLEQSLGWTRVLYLYIAWEAAQARDQASCHSAVAAAANLPRWPVEKLGDALLVRTARTLARPAPDEAKSYLADFGRGDEATELLQAYSWAEPIPWQEFAHLSARRESLVSLLRRGMSALETEGVTLGPIGDPDLQLRELLPLLAQTAFHPSSLQSLDRVLNAVLANPYARYRDLGLEEIGVIVLSVSDDRWVQLTLRRMLGTVLQQATVTFAYDLPFLLLEEAKKRSLPEQERLQDYCQDARYKIDRWGTALRAQIALAAALHRQGRSEAAVEMLKEARGLSAGFAGYASLHMLALANRWWDLDGPQQDLLPSAWGDEMREVARAQAANILDKMLRESRLRLLEAHQSWWEQETPDLEGGLSLLSWLPEAAMRLACIDLLSARWAWLSPVSGRKALTALILHTVADGTTLDAVLARLCTVHLAGSEQGLSDAELTSLIRIWHGSFLKTSKW